MLNCLKALIKRKMRTDEWTNSEVVTADHGQVQSPLYPKGNSRRADKEENGMKLSEADGQRIKVIFVGGATISGIGDFYTPAQDNPEGKASLCVSDAIIFEDEVKKIEVLSPNNQEARQALFFRVLCSSTVIAIPLAQCAF